jgi:Rod binding domain-containing protein
MSTTAALDALRAQAAAAATGEPPTAEETTRLRSLAAEFEAMLLGQMLKEMRASMFEEPDSSSGFGGGPLADSVFAELSLALGRAGGFGLAQAMLQPLVRQALPAPEAAQGARPAAEGSIVGGPAGEAGERTPGAAPRVPEL